MSVRFKITKPLLENIRRDLARPHAHAAERVGFIACRVGALVTGEMIILAHRYHPVEDEDYLQDVRVGAMMGSTAIRKAMQCSLSECAAMFHVHIHQHCGRPWYSETDLTEYAKFVPDFWNVRPEMPHGAILLSQDSMIGLCWDTGSRRKSEIAKFQIMGAPLLDISR